MDIGRLRVSEPDRTNLRFRRHSRPYPTRSNRNVVAERHAERRSGQRRSQGNGQRYRPRPDRVRRECERMHRSRRERRRVSRLSCPIGMQTPCHPPSPLTPLTPTPRGWNLQASTSKGASAPLAFPVTPMESTIGELPLPRGSHRSTCYRTPQAPTPGTMRSASTTARHATGGEGRSERRRYATRRLALSLPSPHRGEREKRGGEER